MEASLLENNEENGLHVNTPLLSTPTSLPTAHHTWAAKGHLLAGFAHWGPTGVMKFLSAVNWPGDANQSKSVFPPTVPFAPRGGTRDGAETSRTPW